MEFMFQFLGLGVWFRGAKPTKAPPHGDGLVEACLRAIRKLSNILFIDKHPLGNS